MKEAVTRIARGVAEMNRCAFEIDWYDAAAPVINTPELALEFQKAVSEVEGIHQVLKEYDMSMGADDFADYLVDKPGVYGLLGSSSSEETSFGHHHEKFDIDESILSVGVSCEVNYILQRLS